MFSTSEGVQYIGGYHNSCGDIMTWRLPYVGDIMSTFEGYREYIGECSVDQEDFT